MSVCIYTTYKREDYTYTLLYDQWKQLLNAVISIPTPFSQIQMSSFYKPKLDCFFLPQHN